MRAKGHPTEGSSQRFLEKFLLIVVGFITYPNTPVSNFSQISGGGLPMISPLGEAVPDRKILIKYCITLAQAKINGF